jgi:hypothetical protein
MKPQALKEAVRREGVPGGAAIYVSSCLRYYYICVLLPEVLG